MNEDLIIQKIIHLEDEVDKIHQKMDTLVTKEDWNKLMDGQDKMIRILERVDQERVFTNERIKRLEDDVSKIKLHLQIA